jgi:hypothetical protein
MIYVYKLKILIRFYDMNNEYRKFYFIHDTPSSANNKNYTFVRLFLIQKLSIEEKKTVSIKI